MRAQRTLERIGEYLGIGIANVIAGLCVPQVILGGGIVFGWKFIRDPLYAAVEQSMAGRITGWTVEPGEPRGTGLGGALEVAVEEFLTGGVLRKAQHPKSNVQCPKSNVPSIVLSHFVVLRVVSWIVCLADKSERSTKSHELTRNSTNLRVGMCDFVDHPPCDSKYSTTQKFSKLMSGQKIIL